MDHALGYLRMMDLDGFIGLINNDAFFPSTSVMFHHVASHVMRCTP